MRVGAAIKTFFRYAGVVLSAMALVLSLFLAVHGFLLTDQRAWPLACYTLAVLLFVFLPQKWQTQDEDSELRPFVQPTVTTRRLSRWVAGAGVLFGVAYFVTTVLTKKPRNDADVYRLTLIANIVLSWLCLMSYVFGIRVFYSEKALAISRHPFFIFRRHWLRRYLRRKARVSRLGRRDQTTDDGT